MNAVEIRNRLDDAMAVLTDQRGVDLMTGKERARACRQVLHLGRQAADLATARERDLREARAQLKELAERVRELEAGGS